MAEQGNQQQNQQGDQGQQQPAIAWAPDLNDPELIGHAQAKQWASPVDAMRAHRELEKLFGADRAGRTITIPKDETDTNGWQQVFSKLGRPENADGYELPVPKDQDGAFAKQAATWFHEAGLPKWQAKRIAEKFNEFMTQGAASDAQAQAEALAAEHAQLAKDWGTGPAALVQREVARRAATKLGLTSDHIDALEKVVGYSGVMKAFAKMGELMGEHKAEGLDQSGGFSTMTPEQARSRRSQLMADPQWVAKAQNPNSAEWAELQRIDMVIFNSQQKAA